MTRNLKALGLALVAVFALSAVAASAASATEFFHSHKEKTILTGVNTNVHKFFPNKVNPPVECKKAEFKGTEVGVKNVGGTLGETWTTTSVTVHPEYSECEFSGKAATVNTNNCHYTLFAATTSEMGDVELLCPAKITESEEAKPQQIEIIISSPAITMLVKPQTLTSAINYVTNKAEGTEKWDVLANTTATGIKWECIKGKAACETAFGGFSGIAAEYTGNTTIKGFVDENETKDAGMTGVYKEGAQTGIWKGPAE